VALAVGLIVGDGGIAVDGSGVTVEVEGGAGDGLEEAVEDGSGCDGGAVRLGSGVAAGLARVMIGPSGSRSRVCPGEQPPMKAATVSADSARARVMARTGVTEPLSRLCGTIQGHPKRRSRSDSRSGLVRVLLGNSDSNPELLLQNQNCSTDRPETGGRRAVCAQRRLLCMRNLRWTMIPVR